MSALSYIQKSIEVKTVFIILFNFENFGTALIKIELIPYKFEMYHHLDHVIYDDVRKRTCQSSIY